MKSQILITAGPYGFGKTWTLEVTGKNWTKSFHLGQDGKVCHRLLGLKPRDVVRAIGTPEIGEGTKGNRALAKFILSQLGLTATKLKGIQPWELSAE